MKKNTNKSIVEGDDEDFEVKHIPCLLIQKRAVVKVKKREQSVVNLLRSHMKDMAKSY